MKIKHYDAGERFYGPMSGERVVALCGVSWQVCGKNKDRVAFNEQSVTCVRCKRKLEKLKSIIKSVADQVESEIKSQSEV